MCNRSGNPGFRLILVPTACPRPIYFIRPGFNSEDQNWSPTHTSSPFWTIVSALLNKQTCPTRRGGLGPRSIHPWPICSNKGHLNASNNEVGMVLITIVRHFWKCINFLFFFQVCDFRIGVRKFFIFCILLLLVFFLKWWKL